MGYEADIEVMRCGGNILLQAGHVRLSLSDEQAQALAKQLAATATLPEDGNVDAMPTVSEDELGDADGT